MIRKGVRITEPEGGGCGCVLTVFGILLIVVALAAPNIFIDAEGIAQESGTDAICGALSDDDPIPIDGLTYKITDEDKKEMELTGYVDAPVNLEIPSTVNYNGNTYKVVSVGSMAFYRCDTLKKLTLGDNVKTIGANAFCFCTELDYVDLSDSVTSVNSFAFGCCDKLTSIVIPGNVEMTNSVFPSTPLSKITIMRGGGTICLMAFDDGFKFYNPDGSEIMYPDYPIQRGWIYEAVDETKTPIEMKPILEGECGDNVAFRLDPISGSMEITGTGQMCNYEDVDHVPWYYGRNYVKTVTMDETVTSIGDFAFFDCGKMTSIEMEGVEKIGEYAFMNCAGITEVSLPSSLTHIGKQAFYNSGLTGKLVLHEGLKSIEDSAFFRCKITSVEINSKSLNTISNSVFRENYELESVVLGDGVSITSIGNDAFAYCKIADLGFLKDVKTIGESAFYQGLSPNITELKLPESVETIYDSSFNYNASLTMVLFPESLKNIERKDLYSVLFDGCTSLSSIDVDLKNSTFKSDRGILYRGNELVMCPIAMEFSDYVILEGTTKIMPYAFGEKDGGSRKNLGNIYIDAALEEIGEGAFKHSKIKSINFGSDDKLKTILDYAFCNSDTEIINFPKSVETIGSSAFENAVMDQTILPLMNVNSIGVKAFYNSNIKEIILENVELNVDIVYNQTFCNVKHLTIGEDVILHMVQMGMTFDNIQYLTVKSEQDCPAMQFGWVSEPIIGDKLPIGSYRNCDTYGSGWVKCGDKFGDGLYWEYKDGAVSVSTYASGSKTIPDFEKNKAPWFDITTYPGVDGDITKVVIGKNVEGIGDNAFNGIGTLAEVEINPESKLGKISDSAFEGTGIKSFLVPRSLGSIGNAFQNIGLEEITVVVDKVKVSEGSYDRFSGIVDGDGNIAHGKYKLTSGKWQRIGYTVTVDPNNGDDAMNIVTDVNGVMKGMMDIPEKKNFYFDGWYDADGNRYTSDSVFEYDITIIAKWSSAPVEYEVSFDVGESGTPPGPMTTKDQKLVSLPKVTREGYHFVGWMNKSGEMVKAGETVFKDNGTLYAKWEIETYTVTIETDEYGTVSPTSVTGVLYGTAITVSGNVLSIGEKTVTATPKNPTAEYEYKFSKWSVKTGTKVTGDITVTAMFERTAKTYTIMFDTAGGSKIDPIEVKYGEPIPETAVPKKDGHKFDGWEPELPEIMPAENLKVTAKWILDEEHEYIEEDTIPKGEPLKMSIKTTELLCGVYVYINGKPEGPLKEGDDYETVTEGGWLTVTLKSEYTGKLEDGEYSIEVDFENGDVARDDFTVHSSPGPAPEPTPGPVPVSTYYEVSYDIAGGSEPGPGTASYEEGAEMYVASYIGYKDGYTFGGWSCNGKTYQAGDEFTVNGDMKFTAVWNASPGPEPTPSDDNNTGLIIGIVVAVIAAIAVIGGAVYFVRKK